MIKLPCAEFSFFSTDSLAPSPNGHRRPTKKASRFGSPQVTYPTKRVDMRPRDMATPPPGSHATRRTPPRSWRATPTSTSVMRGGACGPSVAVPDLKSNVASWIDAVIFAKITGGKVFDPRDRKLYAPEE